MRQLADAAMAFAYADGAIAPALSVPRCSLGKLHAFHRCLFVCVCVYDESISVSRGVCYRERNCVCVYVHVLCMCVCACGSVRGSVSVRESV